MKKIIFFYVVICSGISIANFSDIRKGFYKTTLTSDNKVEIFYQKPKLVRQTDHIYRMAWDIGPKDSQTSLYPLKVTTYERETIKVMPPEDSSYFYLPFNYCKVSEICRKEEQDNKTWKIRDYYLKILQQEGDVFKVRVYPRYLDPYQNMSQHMHHFYGISMVDETLTLQLHSGKLFLHFLNMNLQLARVDAAKDLGFLLWEEDYKAIEKMDGNSDSRAI